MIERSVTVEIKPTPFELAREFCEMDAYSQAMFLNEIANIVDVEWNRQFCFQVQAIVDSSGFLNGANKIMKIFGEYAGNS